MVKPGYKQTEVGVIPEDWDFRTLHELTAQIIDGTHFTPRYTTHGIPFLRVTDIQRQNVDLIETKFISDKQHRDLICRCRPELGDLLLSKNGTIGIPKIVDWQWEFSIFVSLALIKLKPDVLSVTYLEQYIKSGILTAQIRRQSKQGTVTNLHLEEIRLFTIPYPSLPEQQAIAGALSDVDGLLGSLEALIEKKRAIKTGAMQQLLTGKTRLPGFGEGTGYKQTEVGVIPEDWEVKSYGAVFEFLSTATNSRSDLSQSGEFKYIHYGDIHTKWEHTLNLNKNALPTISKSLIGKPIFVENGDLVIVDASEDYDGIGKSVEVFKTDDVACIAGLHTMLLRDLKGLFSKGYKGYLHSIEIVKRQMDRLATGLKVYGLSKTNIRIILFPMPSTPEQEAIIEVLSDMDEELEALEQRLEKTRQLKQGMMQELLTGRTRLL